MPWIQRYPFHAAAQGGDYTSLCTQLEAKDGAALKLINTRDDDGWTPLSYAAWYGHAQCCKKLVESGAAITTLNANGSTPVVSPFYTHA